MVHNTKGIVLRNISYGETSVIVLIYTELFGIQSYLVNGVRTTKKTSAKSQFFQPAAILDLVVYHNTFKQLQRIKEVNWHYLYQTVFFNISKNAIALFMTELLQKAIRQPEPHPDLYQFIEEAYIRLDNADKKTVAGSPLFFVLQLAPLLGFGISDDYTAQNCFLDLREGKFVDEIPLHPNYLEAQPSAIVSELLKTINAVDTQSLRLALPLRRKLLEHLLQFYALHITDFGNMKTVPVLQEVLE